MKPAEKRKDGLGGHDLAIFGRLPAFADALHVGRPNIGDRERFLERIFTDIERQKSEARAQRAASYAKRFAAKEACAKALGTGLRRGVYWRDMGVINLPSGRPTIRLTGGAARQLADLTPEGYEARIDLTLTDDFPLAAAIVIISGLPDKADRR